MSVARLNFSHGTAAEHAARVPTIRDAARAAGRHIAILADLPGPKVRLGPLRGGKATLVEGATFTFLAGLDALDGDGDETRAATTHAGLAGDLAPGDRIQLSDGAVEVVVLAIDGNAVTTIIERGGVGPVAGRRQRARGPALAAGHRRPRPRARAARGGPRASTSSGSRSCGPPRTSIELRALLGPDGPAIVAKIETRSAVDGFEAVAARRGRRDGRARRPRAGAAVRGRAARPEAARPDRGRDGQARDRRDPDARVDDRRRAPDPGRGERRRERRPRRRGRGDAVGRDGDRRLPGPRRRGRPADRGRGRGRQRGGRGGRRTPMDVLPVGRGGALAVAAVGPRRARPDRDASSSPRAAQPSGAVAAAARRPGGADRRRHAGRADGPAARRGPWRVAGRARRSR